MIKKFAILACLVSFAPVAAGAQEVALMVGTQPTPAAVEVQKSVNLMPREDRSPVLLAANEVQGARAAGEERQAKTHTGLTFKEFCDVHFGENRWMYWVGAAVALVALHVAVAD